MDYIVWVDSDVEGLYEKVPCGGLKMAEEQIELAIRQGKHPVMTVQIIYAVNINISEVKSEAKESKTKLDKSPANKGNGQV